MIDCSNAEMRDLLPDVAGGRDRLTPAQRAAVEAHLAICPACREELALLEAVRRAWSGAPGVDVAKVTAALPRPADRRRARPWSSGAWRSAAAVALVAVGLSSAWLARTLRDGAGPETGIDSAAGPGAAGAESPVALGYRLSELSESDLESLLGALEDLEALPAAEPAPVIAPLGGEEGP